MVKKDNLFWIAPVGKATKPELSKIMKKKLMLILLLAGIVEWILKYMPRPI